MLFSLDQMFFFVGIYVTLLFPNFKLIFYEYCVLFTVHWFYYTISRLSKSSHFWFIYPCWQITLLGKQEWVYSIVRNHCSKQNLKNRGMLQFLLHHNVYSLYLFLTFILLTQVNNLYQVSGRLIKNIPASFRLRFLKIEDIT